MRFLALLVATFGAVVAGQATSGPPWNPINTITGVVAVGKPITVTWSPNTSGTVTLQLRQGNGQNLDPGTTIASSIPNTGSYSWTPSTDLASGSDYTIEIINDAYPGTQTNYSHTFTISGVSASSSSTKSSSNTSSSGTTSNSSTTSSSSTTSNSATTTTTSASSTTSKSSTSNSASKTTSSTAKVPSSNVGHKIGQGVAAVVGMGMGALVVGL